MRRHGARGPGWTVARTVAVAFLALLATAPSARAQDIPAQARALGVELPQGYWDRVARDPDFFELPNGLFGGTAGALRAPSAIRDPRPPVLGTTQLPVVLALFSNSAEPQVTAEMVDQSIFTGPAPNGTLTEFYQEISGDRFTVNGQVFPWVRTGLTMEAVVGSSYGLGSDARVGEYLVQALALNDDEVDFGQFDNDGPDGIPNSGDDDRIVDVLVFEFLEVAASCGGPSIWPHRSSLLGWNDEPYVTNDMGAGGEPILVSGYIIQGVTDCGGVNVQSAGTISHEFGHALGLPDYYHPINGIEPEHRRWVLGCWSLMAAGSWGCGPVGTLWPYPGPSHMISWSKHWLGWLDYVDVGEVHDAEYVLEPVETSGTALRIPLDGEGQENLLVEFRKRESFDVYIPATGVLVVHQDFLGATRPESGTRYYLRMEEADGNASLVKVLSEGGSRGEPSDAFALDGMVGRMNGETTPSTRRNTGVRSTVTIHSIEVDGDQARIRVSNSPDPVVVVPEEGIAAQQVGSFEERMRIAGGASPYFVSLQGTPPGGVEVYATQDELVIHGEPADWGSFEINLNVADFYGTMGAATVTLTVAPFDVEQDRLLAPLLRTPGLDLTAAEKAYLDQVGNANGSFDIGDARAWLMGGS